MMGNWVPSDRHRREGYNGSVFGPTNLIINNECNGEDPKVGDGLFPGMGGENRRIKVKIFNKNGQLRNLGLQMVL